MLLCQVPERKRRVSFPCRKQVFFGMDEMQLSQQSLVSGVSFPKQVSRPPCSPHWPVLIWLWLPRVPAVRTQAGKTGRDIKEARVWKRKTRMRCRGNVLVNTGCSYRGPFQVDHPVCLFQTHHPPSFPFLGGWVRLTSMPKTDNALWHCALMAEFIDIFIRVGPKSRRREVLKTICLPEAL